MNERPSVINLTAADRAAMGDDGHDTPFVGKSEMTLVYAASPEVLVGGPSFVPGAQVGGYAVSQGDKRIAFNNGVLFHPIGFRLSHPEYGPDVGDKRGQYLRDHGVARPDAAVWRDADGFQIQKAGFLTEKASLLRSCKGVGPKDAQMILARLPETGALDRRKIAALVGVAPITCKSGSSINRASIAGGRKPLRDTLFMAALSASSHNPTFIAFRDRLKANGKPHKLIIVAVIRNSSSHSTQ